MTDLSTLNLTTFTPLIGDHFDAHTSDGKVALILREATQLGKAVREGGAFSLVFSAADGTAVGQQTCPITHDKLGELMLFLVPIGPGPDGMGYEAVFT